MSPPGPIYASTLHRRDRTWRPRRRGVGARTVVWSGAGTAIAAMLLAHFG
jgi:hypothetical protein